MMFWFFDTGKYETCSENTDDCMSDLLMLVSQLRLSLSKSQRRTHQELQDATANRDSYNERRVRTLILSRHGLVYSLEVEQAISLV